MPAGLLVRDAGATVIFDTQQRYGRACGTIKVTVGNGSTGVIPDVEPGDQLFYFFIVETDIAATRSYIPVLPKVTVGSNSLSWTWDDEIDGEVYLVYGVM